MQLLSHCALPELSSSSPARPPPPLATTRALTASAPEAMAPRIDETIGRRMNDKWIHLHEDNIHLFEDAHLHADFHSGSGGGDPNPKIVPMACHPEKPSAGNGYKIFFENRIPINMWAVDVSPENCKTERRFGWLAPFASVMNEGFHRVDNGILRAACSPGPIQVLEKNKGGGSGKQSAWKRVEKPSAFKYTCEPAASSALVDATLAELRLSDSPKVWDEDQSTKFRDDLMRRMRGPRNPKIKEEDGEEKYRKAQKPWFKALVLPTLDESKPPVVPVSPMNWKDGKPKKATIQARNGEDPKDLEQTTCFRVNPKTRKPEEVSVQDMIRDLSFDKTGANSENRAPFPFLARLRVFVCHYWINDKGFNPRVEMHQIIYELPEMSNANLSAPMPEGFAHINGTSGAAHDEPRVKVEDALAPPVKVEAAPAPPVKVEDAPTPAAKTETTVEEAKAEPVAVEVPLPAQAKMEIAEAPAGAEEEKAEAPVKKKKEKRVKEESDSDEPAASEDEDDETQKKKKKRGGPKKQQ